MTVAFEFNAENHQYTAGGVLVPSVSQVLRESGLIDYAGIDPAVLKYAAERGTAVHTACCYLDDEDLDVESLDPLLAGYVTGWQNFRRRYPFKVLASERPYLGTLHGLQFGMTLDRLLDWPGHPFTILDIKCTSKIEPHHGVQLAGYAIGVASNNGERAESYRRVVVQLKRNGEYRMHEFKDEEDGHIFAAALRIAHWKQGRYTRNGR